MMQQLKPYAYIATKLSNGQINRRAARIVNGEKVLYYAQKETPFIIELGNPTDKIYAAEILINGKAISQSKIILYPGMHEYLERYIDSDERFMFRKYEIDNTNEAINATKDNGLVEIRFYEEYQEPQCFTYTSYCPPNWGTPMYFYDGITGSDNITYNECSDIISSPNITPTTTCDCLFNAEVEPQGGRGMSAGIGNKRYSKRTKGHYGQPVGGRLQTGVITPGGQTGQEMREVSGLRFSIFWSWNYTYRLLPDGALATHIKQRQTKYCTACGRKHKDSWVFCPGCGKRYE